MSTKVITNKARASYAHVFVPNAVEEGQAKKYSCCLIIPKEDTATIGAIEAAVQEALEIGKAKLGGKIPARWKNPLRDGDDEKPDDENYTGCMFVNANSNTKPVLVSTEKTDDGKFKQIMSQEDYEAKVQNRTADEVGKIDGIRSDEEFYSGCYCRASVNFYAFNVSGNKGVACGLNSLQKLEDGENLGGGRTSAEDDFGGEGDDLNF